MMNMHETLYKHKKIIIVMIVAMSVASLYVLTKEKKHDAIKIEEESYSMVHEEPKTINVIKSTNQEANAVPVAPLNKEVIAARLAILQEKQQELQQRLTAPLMPINNGSAPQLNTEEPHQEAIKSSNPNTQFWLDASRREFQTAQAVPIGSLNAIVAEGSFIHAILEPATNSDLPGSLRAIVNEPTYAEDGSRILIPRGSRLIGEYKSGIQQGQSRIFIVWNRLITPEGFSLNLGSQGTDSLGRAGQGADSINRHFWERFGSAALLSMIGTGTATLDVSGNDQENSASSYRTAVANSFAQSANQSMEYSGSMAPTLETWQGKPIMVFVAKDLHFEQAIKANSINIL